MPINMRSVVAASLLAAGIFLTGSGGSRTLAAKTDAPPAPATRDEKPVVETETRPVASVETPRGTIRIRLYPEEAPKAVANFIKLANKGYYDGLRFHRVEPGFVIQGGDPKGDGSGGPGYTIPDEKNKKLKHVLGAVAMAKSTAANSAGSQFYIVIGKPAKELDGRYTVFGQVIEGQSAANAMRRGDPMFKVSIIEPTPPVPPAPPAPGNKPTQTEPHKKG